jgi:flagellar hook-length control protein FliK
VFSVTSEAAASVSFQNAQPKPARPDPSSLNDSFGALVDSSIPTDTGNDRTASAAPQPPASQRSPDDAAAGADNTRSQNASADRAAQNASDDRNASAQQASDANAAANADAGTAAAQQSKAKSGAAKDGTAKTSDKPSSDKASATDQVASAPQGGASVTTPNPVAVAIPVATISTDAPATPPATGNATAPLAIAAAAIAASTAKPVTTPAAPSAEVKVDVDSTATATATANAAAAASAKTSAQAAAAATVATTTKQPVSQTTATDAGLTAAVAATAPVAPKATLLKTPVAAQAKTAASSSSDTGSAKSDAAATGTPESALQTNAAQATAKPAAGADGTDAAKAEVAANAASAAAPAAHDHAPITTTSNTPTDAVDTGTQVTGTIQPQLPTVAATAAPAGSLSVTAATNAPVPLSGLALEIAASAKSGKSSFEIRLDPADLGRIDVRIDVDRNGQVTSHLTVEKPETLSMLRQDAPQLQRALDDAGFKTGDSGLQFSLRDQSSSGQNSGNETGRNAQRLVISSEDTIPATVAGQTYGRMLGSSSGVDIRV